MNIYFSWFRLFIIVINCMALALDRYPLTIRERKLHVWFLFLINFLYIIETVVVMAAIGVKNYLKDIELVVDVSVNITVIIEFIMW